MEISTVAAQGVQKYTTSVSQPLTQSDAVEVFPEIKDKVTISPDAFRVEMNVEDYLPQSRDLKKKNFKNVKEYAEYLLMLFMKLQELKPKPGELHVKMEDQAELRKAISDLGDVKLV